MELNRDSWASLFFLAAGMGVCIWSLQYELGVLAAPGPGFMALCAGVVVSLLSIVGFLSNWRMPRKEGRLWGTLWVNSLVVVLLLIGFPLLLNFLGFSVCTFLFVLILIRRIRMYGWTVVLGWSLGTTVAMYLVFEVWLQARLPMGLLRYVGL